MSGRITRGQAESILHAFGSGGWAVLKHSKVVHGAPADQLGDHGAIRPLDWWNGRHFCAEDWHVILVADVEGGDETFTHRDAEEVMSEIEVVFELDGVVLPTTRTSISRFNNPERFDLTTAFYFQQGRIMSPEELTVGAHNLRMTMSYRGEQMMQAISFTIDPPGQGACG